MRTIKAEEITRRVATLCIEANTCLPADVKAALEKAREEEPWPLAKQTLGLLRSKHILIVPGSGFDYPEPDHLRIVMLPRPDELKAAMQQLHEYLLSRE